MSIRSLALVAVPLSATVKAKYALKYFRVNGRPVTRGRKSLL